MDAGVAAAWAGSITGVVALVLSIITLFTSKRAAKRSAAAAERSAKTAEGATEVAREELALSKAEADHYAPPWRLFGQTGASSHSSTRAARPRTASQSLRTTPSLGSTLLTSRMSNRVAAFGSSP